MNSDYIDIFFRNFATSFGNAFGITSAAIASVPFVVHYSSEIKRIFSE